MVIQSLRHGGGLLVTATSRRIGRTTLLQIRPISIKHWFKPPPIEELPEMKAIETVQTVITKAKERQEISARHVETFQEWLKAHRAEQSLDASAQEISKESLTTALNHCIHQVQQQEAALWDPTFKLGIVEANSVEEAALDSCAEAVQIKLIKHKYMQIVKLLAKAPASSTPAQAATATLPIEKLDYLVQLPWNPDNDVWLKGQFDFFDEDKDGAVGMVESRECLRAVITVQCDVLREIFDTQVALMPKKHMKRFEDAVYEEEWNSKIAEKLRCVWEFSEKIPHPTNKDERLLQWNQFLTAQHAEIPELHDFLSIYVKGFYDDRFKFHRKANEKRKTRLRGLALFIALGISDYIFMQV